LGNVQVEAVTAGQTTGWRKRLISHHRVTESTESLSFFFGEKLKQECGTIKEGMIEIQSERREKIADVLRKLRYKVKVAGG